MRADRCLKFVVLAVVLEFCVQAQPFIFYRSIFNAASYASAGLPNGSLARGSIFSIFGRALGPAEGVQVSEYPLQDELAGVSIEVCQGESCSAAIPIYVRADQINAIMPSDAPLGEVSIRVTYNGGAGNFSPAEVVDASVGLFAANSGGFGPGIVQNFVSASETPLNTLTAATARGGIVIAWGTGLGAGLNPDTMAPAAGDVATNVEIFLGDAPVTNILYHGRTPCCSGVDQFVFEVPDDAPFGCYVPLTIRTNQNVVSNQVTVAVTETGESCVGDDPIQKALVDGGKTGAVALTQITREDRQLGLEFTQELEIVEAYFSDEAGSPFAYAPLYAQTPVGSCMVSQARSAAPFVTLRPGQSITGDLDAGAMLTVQGGGSAGQIERGVLGRPGYVGEVGIRNPASGDDALILENATEVTFSGTGGGDVGPFTVTTPVGERIQWLNKDEIDMLDRGAGVTVTWTPTSAAFVSIFGGTRDRVTNTTVWFDCLAESAAGTFTVEPWVLSNLAPPRVRESQQEAWLGLSAVAGEDAEFSTDGIDTGIASAYAPVVKTVRAR